MHAHGQAGPHVERKTCRAPDDVEIVYSAAGTGEPALVFVHGGLADRTFFAGQLEALSEHRRVIALDLAGHGESGTTRQTWGLPEFGGDVKAVVALRAINGDLFPTDVAAIRRVKADFDAVVMTHTGHYPMLEKPAGFNRSVVGVVEAIEGQRSQR